MEFGNPNILEAQYNAQLACTQLSNSIKLGRVDKQVVVVVNKNMIQESSRAVSAACYSLFLEDRSFRCPPRIRDI